MITSNAAEKLKAEIIYAITSAHTEAAEYERTKYRLYAPSGSCSLTMTESSACEMGPLLNTEKPSKRTETINAGM